MRPVLVGLLVLASCSTAPGVSEADLSRTALGALAGPGLVGSFEVSLQVDYVLERFTLVRARTAQGPAADEPVGVSLGNGLFLDNAGNLAVRADALLGLGAESQGRSLFVQDDRRREVVYDGHKVVVSDTPAGPWGSRYEVVPTSTKVILPNLIVLTDAAGTVTVDHRDTLVENQVWAPVTGGASRTLGFQRSQQFVLGAQGVTDTLGQLRLEPHGDYLLVVYQPGADPGLRVRLYRSPTRYLLLDERTGETTVFDLSPNTVTGPGFSLAFERGRP